ncbi:hypothetical protein KQI84_12800 [bacterium]|nr:hypothetical protein [bacterium]
MSEVKPWLRIPFEQIVQAELHRALATDIDRRIAFIVFDNATEISISTYLNLKPRQRNNRTYDDGDIEKWLKNFPSRIKFLQEEYGRRKVTPTVDFENVNFLHGIRNHQYHVGEPVVPLSDHLDEIAKSTKAIFSFLFDIPDIEKVVSARLDKIFAERNPSSDPVLDQLLDEEFPPVEIAGLQCPYSKALFLLAPQMYSFELSEMDISGNVKEDLNKRCPRSLRPDLVSISIAHHTEVIYLVVTTMGGETYLEQIGIYNDPAISCLFEFSESAHQNADTLANELDPVVIAERTSLFNERAKRRLLGRANTSTKAEEEA